MNRVAILDDYQSVALGMADWKAAVRQIEGKGADWRQ